MSSKIVCTTDHGVMCVSNVTNKSNQQNLDGELLATRKNPHAIAAGSGPDMPVNCWCIIATAICTTPVQSI
jgi:hypothetical protein